MINKLLFLLSSSPFRALCFYHKQSTVWHISATLWTPSTNHGLSEGTTHG